MLGSGWQVDGRVQALSSSSFGLYLGGEFGLAIYEDSSRARTLFSTPNGGIQLTGDVYSLAAADGCVYVAGALRVVSPGASAHARLVRYCPSTGASSNSTIDAMALGDPSVDWKMGLVLHGLKADSMSSKETPSLEVCAAYL
jgi:hypothetical protein